MNKVLLLLVSLFFVATPVYAWNDIGIGSYEDPVRMTQENSPNYNSNFYDRNYSKSYNDNYKNDYNDAESGHDIRDYNPYYDRYGI